MFHTFFSYSLFALRQMRNRPWFTMVVILTLAVGIGANTAMFSTINATMFRALPYEDPDRLVMGRATFDGGINPTASAFDYYDYQEMNASFEYLSAFGSMSITTTVSGVGETERVEYSIISWDLFTILGVNPQIGRHFTAEEGTAEGAISVLISHGYWQRQFGGDTNIIGTNILISGDSFTIVGVMPESFHFYLDVDMWLPMYRDGPYAGGRRWHNWLLVGRLNQGITIGQAQSELDAISARLEELYPETNQGKALLITDLHDVLIESDRKNLLLLMVTVALVLLIACGNVASLLLAKGSSRRTEMAVRAAMGAPRSRLVSQLLTESVLMGIFGGILGILLALWMESLILRLLPLDTLGITRLGLDTPVLLFAIGLSLATGLLFGIIPALRGAGGNLIGDLKSGTRSIDTSGGTRFRSSLVALQVALSVILLMGSGLLIKSFSRLTSVDIGFDTNNLLTAEIQLSGVDYSDLQQRIIFYSNLLEDIRSRPGVQAVGLITQLPIRNPGNNIYVYNAANPPITTRESQVAYTRVVMPGYFEAMKIPIIMGRDIEESDIADKTPVMVINQTMADSLFPGENPIGGQVAVDMGEIINVEVVGVVGSVRLSGLRYSPRLAMYGSYLQQPYSTMRLAIRTDGNPSLLASALRDAVTRLDRNIPLAELVSMESLISGNLSGQRIVTASLSLFSMVALLLTAVGLYGILAFYVSKRTHEIGVRMALGASSAIVLGSILKRGLTLVSMGLVAGLIGAFGATRLIQQMLFDTEPTDPITFLLVTIFFIAVALPACLLPGWKAMKVDPIVALRAE